MSGRKALAPELALRASLRRNANDLLAYFERRVANREDAADLLSDTMLHAWRRVDKLPDEPERQRMWLYTIAANMMANHRRASRRRSALVERLACDIALTANSVDRSEDSSVLDAVSRLPALQRELVALIHWDGFSINEAAIVLGLNASTARSRYSSARRALRENLATEHPA